MSNENTAAPLRDPVGAADRARRAKDALQQYGALPYRLTDAGLEVLLVTSLGRGRWIIPKGWPNEGEGFAAAAREAFEEAGVEGRAAPEPIGAYEYSKFRSGRARVVCRVDVHPILVTSELEHWPEAEVRRRRWFTAEAAAAAVKEKPLASLLRAAPAVLTGPDQTGARLGAADDTS